jgi:hypothetical protein
MRRSIICVVVYLVSALMAAAPAARAQNTPQEAQKPDQTAERRFQANGQTTFTLQSLFKFRSPYEGANSLRSRYESEMTHSYTLYLGARVRHNLEAYINPEMIRGKGISDALGVAGFTSGEVIRNPTLGQDPYLARYFIRWTVPTGAGEENVEGAQNQVAGMRPSHRLVSRNDGFAGLPVYPESRLQPGSRTRFRNVASAAL